MDKIHKEINNIDDLLEGKYNERDILLKKGKTEYFYILDNEIQNMELEKVELEKLKDEINNNFDNYKTQLCRYYEIFRKCDKNNKCNYAHGLKELKNNKKGCINKLNCYDETCLSEHPNNWKPYNNKIKCLNCIKGSCNKTNNKYLHINNTRFKLIVNKIILINKIIKYLNKYIKKEDIKINEIENIDPKNKITSDYNYYKDNFNIYDKENAKNINKIIYKMEKDLKIYSKKIITNINILDIDDIFKINIKTQINHIKSKIQLLKYNIEEI